MKPRAPRPLDPRRLDVDAITRDAVELTGEWPLPTLPRLVEATHEEARPSDADTARWSIRGELRPIRGGEPQRLLHLRADTRLALVCQRCLGPVEQDIHAERSFLFAADETAAAELDAIAEEDVLAMTPSLDAQELIEDELLLALPLVPRHDVCPTPLPMSAGEDEIEAPPNPFAALARLRSGGQ